jgi:hypothetical protein
MDAYLSLRGSLADSGADDDWIAWALDEGES